MTRKDAEWETTSQMCPRCTAKLLTRDDPDQDHWGSTSEWKCPACGYYAASDFELERDEYVDFEDDE